MNEDFNKHLRHVSSFKGICTGQVISRTITHIDGTVSFLFNETFAKLVLKAIEDDDISNMTKEQQDFFKAYMGDAEDDNFSEEVYKQFDEYLGEIKL